MMRPAAKLFVHVQSKLQLAIDLGKSELSISVVQTKEKQDRSQEVGKRVQRSVNLHRVSLLGLL